MRHHARRPERVSPTRGDQARERRILDRRSQVDQRNRGQRRAGAARPPHACRHDSHREDGADVRARRLMSVEPVLLALQALFLILLYVFIWRVIRSAARDLRVPQESFIMAPSQLASAGASAPPAPAGRLVVASSSAVVKGNAYEAGPVPLTIGRAEDNTVALAG